MDKEEGRVMVPTKVLKNIRIEMQNYVEMINQLEHLTFEMFYKKKDYVSIVSFMINSFFELIIFAISNFKGTRYS